MLNAKTSLNNTYASQLWPGENWFFYWKISASQWESKISEYSAPGPIFIPVYWGFHQENSEKIDFGDINTECDLARLVKIFQNLNKECIFLFSTGALPFLANGGFPSFLSREPQIDKDGLKRSVINNLGEVSQLYSLYEPRVYAGFKKFISHFNEMLNKEKLSVRIMALTFDYFNDFYPAGIEQDYSVSFQNAFEKYSMSNAGAPEVFRFAIQELYLETIKEVLERQFIGIYPSVFLGSSETELTQRSIKELDLTQQFLYQAIQSLVWKKIPSSILLMPHEMNAPLKYFFSNLIHSSYVESSILSHSSIDHPNVLMPLKFIFLVMNSKEKSHLNYIVDSGILSSIGEEYANSYSWLHKVNLEEELEKESQFNIYSFVGDKLSAEDFSSIIKLFFAGKKVIFDSANLNEDLKLRFDHFLQENQLQPTVLNSLTQIQIIELTEGMLLSYDGSKIKNESSEKKHAFFSQIFKFLNFPNPKITADENLFHFWRNRQAVSGDLNYQEIRRISFINPTNKTLKGHVAHDAHFAFLKAVDPSSAQFKSLPTGVSVEIAAKGFISLEYGYFE